MIPPETSRFPLIITGDNTQDKQASLEQVLATHYLFNRELFKTKWSILRNHNGNVFKPGIIFSHNLNGPYRQDHMTVITNPDEATIEMSRSSLRLDFLIDKKINPLIDEVAFYIPKKYSPDNFNSYIDIKSAKMTIKQDDGTTNIPWIRIFRQLYFFNSKLDLSSFYKPFENALFLPDQRWAGNFMLTAENIPINYFDGTIQITTDIATSNKQQFYDITFMAFGIPENNSNTIESDRLYSTIRSFLNDGHLDPSLQ